MSPRIRPLALALVLTALAATGAHPATDLRDARAALQAAVNRGDPAAIQGVRARFEAAAAADPRDAAARYWVALADWRAIPLLWSKDPSRARVLAKDGLKRIGEAIALAPGMGGAYALKAGLQGLSIGLEPANMMTLGMEAETHLQRARGLAPGDPRVWVLDGIQALNKPAMFGGGAVAALERFARAQELFAALAPAADSVYGWGRDDAFVWAGRAEMTREHPAEALAHYRRALEVNPSNAWVERALIPAAQQALAERR